MKEIKVPLELLLEVLTYNQLFDYVHLPSSIGAQISLADPQQQHCHVEPLNTEVCIVWYPIKSWIDECKRRKELTHISQAFKDRRKEVVTLTDLNNKLLQACVEGNMEEMQKLTEQIQKLTK